MYCKVCGNHRARGSSSFCRSCEGKATVTASALSEHVQATAGESTLSRTTELLHDKPKYKMKLVDLIVITIVIIAAIISGWLFYFFQSKYTEAKSLYNNKQYGQAAVAFAELGSFKDSRDLELESHYLHAKQLIQNKEYSKARSALIQAKNYENAGYFLQVLEYAPLYGTWKAEKGYPNRQFGFFNQTAYYIYFPNKKNQSVETRHLMKKGSGFKDVSGTEYYVDNDKLYIKEKDRDAIAHIKISDTTDIQLQRWRS